MGVDARSKPPLPAPTTSPSATGGSTVGTDLATDISRRTDRTSYSIPDDGSPITISTRRKGHDRGKEPDTPLSRATQHSQTSLLIEYFEGGKPGTSVQSRPSVRVKVTPSAARKIKETTEHIQISESSKARQPSYTKRISLSPNVKGDKIVAESADDRSQSSYASATEESNLASRRPPVEIEVLNQDHGSPTSAMSSPRDSRYIQPNPSEISSMPPEPLFESRDANRTPRRNRSRSLTREEVRVTDTLKTPSRRRSRSLSKERITQKVLEKLGNKPVESGSKHKHGAKSRSRSDSKDHAEVTKSGRRRSSKSHREDEFLSGAESSVLTSQLSPSRKSGDQYSFRSGTSKSSINNPKLLETVEDAIRRLILPELTALKNEHKTSRNRTKFDETTRDSMTSGTSVSRDNSSRRVSKMSSAPDVGGKPKVVLHEDDHSPGILLSGDSIKGRKERKSSRGTLDSASRKSSGERVIDEKSHRKRSKEGNHLREVAAAGMAGALTTAALRHHDSKSSVDGKKHRKKRSKSRSRSASLAEDLDSTRKEDIPPMPMSSDIHSSEVTRTSILTEQTERPQSPMSDDQRTPVRELSSPASRTPNKALQRGLGTHHSNVSRGDLSLRSGKSDQSLVKGDASRGTVEAGHATSDSGSPAGLASKDYEQVESPDRRPEARYHSKEGYYTGPNRNLSPIQSVASYKDDSIVEPAQRDSYPRTHSSQSLSSIGQGNDRKNSTLSIESLSSSPSSKIASSRRNRGLGHENRTSGASQDALRASEFTRDVQTPKDVDMEYWYEQHQENDRHRSLESSSTRDPKIDIKHMTNYTDDSMDGTYLDQVAAGQHVRGIGANPEYRHTPVAVESAVASLLDASIISSRSKPEERSYPNSMDEYALEGDHFDAGIDRGLATSEQNSPTKMGSRKPYDQMATASSQGSFHQRSLGASSRKGLSPTAIDEDIYMGASGLPVADDPLPEIGHGLDEDSEMTTNPSIIQGPIGGAQHDNRDHWPYEPTPPQSDGNLLGGHNAHDERYKAGEAALLAGSSRNKAGASGPGQADVTGEHDGGAEGYEKPSDAEKSYKGGIDRELDLTPDPYGNANVSHVKDEGYISAANPRSPGAITPDSKPKGGLGLFDNEGGPGLEDILGNDDPFVGKGHTRHLSGNSHGMASPLYDSAMGKGLDRIMSKDVVALMDHLTVRDAQRNARDTEILVTLVRSAAEMRNSFEDMKRLMAEQENTIINTTDKNVERSVQKVINGPRPQPLGTPRFPRRTSAEEDMIEDIPAKRRNVFRRVVKGLSSKSTNDLTKIEDMLMQLLDDVEGLKAAQDSRPPGTQTNSLKSFDNLRPGPEGYEPEGQAGTGSTNQSGSGYFSNPPSRQASAMRSSDRRISEHRVSTVPEGDEELAAQEDKFFGNAYTNDDQLLTPPHRQRQLEAEPLETPPQIHAPTGSLSNDNSPRTEKSKKHKTTSSSFIPKISRWSETTASTVANRFRMSGRKDKEYSEPASRSGSEPDFWDNSQQHTRRVSDKLHTMESREDVRPVSERSPSPLLPQDDPKYQAHRDSLNLQHPQPRQGPTHRHQHYLETQAHTYGSPGSPADDQFGLGVSLNRFSGASGRYSGGGHLSPISDAGYSERSAADQVLAPPLPPKVKDDPLVPAHPPKVRASYEKPQYASPIRAAKAQEQRYSNGSDNSQMNGSVRSASGQIMGPRPQSSRRPRKPVGESDDVTF
ncbi:MAG: hypothetical protein M1833_005156 [Piccolia ochrophora]|nr:MAG: hypothetical protein M1833_005156 [Piccolia ochrophora]